jgi:NitT/TauT family transport system substrate-binding protein
MKIMSSDTPEGKAAREAMGKASGTDLAGYEAQLKTTRMFYEPKEATSYAMGPSIYKTMDLVRNFLFSHGLLGQGAPSADVVGIAFPDGKVLGDKGNVKLRFTAAYMNEAAKAK